MTAHNSREFDIILYGATGYTGRPVAAYTAPIIAAWANADALSRMAAPTRAVLATVDPYQFHGEALVERLRNHAEIIFAAED